MLRYVLRRLWSDVTLPTNAKSSQVSDARTVSDHSLR